MLNKRAVGTSSHMQNTPVLGNEVIQTMFRYLRYLTHFFKPNVNKSGFLLQFIFVLIIHCVRLFYRIGLARLHQCMNQLRSGLEPKSPRVKLGAFALDYQSFWKHSLSGPNSIQMRMILTRKQLITLDITPNINDTSLMFYRSNKV